MKIKVDSLFDPSKSLCICCKKMSTRVRFLDYGYDKVPVYSCECHPEIIGHRDFVKDDYWNEFDGVAFRSETCKIHGKKGGILVIKDGSNFFLEVK